MRCYYHPEVETSAVCSVCGKAICHDCAVNVGDEIRCRECLATGSVATRETTFEPINKKAQISMLLGLGGWLVWLLLLCFNSTVGFLVGMATMGVGLICLIPLGLLPYLGWIPAIITGHSAIKELNQGGNIERGRGMAVTGLVSGYLALGITLLGCLILVILTVAGVSIPIVDEIIQSLS
ncbi:MAG: DUF4190 domain-containing protein [Anaerolineales bacterium]|nr:DUF4190 domain-containing protein [Anaerolineales bacterium]